ncbi:MAG: hypothetical protein IPG11_13005 [Flavobacteriales bacterium]|nr:hypothetical protein [Flavobacteriales bacterium]
MGNGQLVSGGIEYQKTAVLTTHHHHLLPPVDPQGITHAFPSALELRM